MIYINLIKNVILHYDINTGLQLGPFSEYYFFEIKFYFQIPFENFVKTNAEVYFCCKCCKNIPQECFFGNTGIQEMDEGEACNNNIFSINLFRKNYF